MFGATILMRSSLDPQFGTDQNQKPVIRSLRIQTGNPRRVSGYESAFGEVQVEHTLDKLHTPFVQLECPNNNCCFFMRPKNRFELAKLV